MLLSLPTALLLEMCKISRIVRNNVRTLQHLHHTKTLAIQILPQTSAHYNTCTRNITANLQWEIQCTPSLLILVLLYLARAKFSFIVMVFNNINENSFVFEK